MINPKLVRPNIIVHVEDDEQWQELQGLLRISGARNKEDVFDESMPFRWIEMHNGHIEWFCGTADTALSPEYNRGYEMLSFSDLCYGDSEMDASHVIGAMDGMWEEGVS